MFVGKLQKWEPVGVFGIVTCVRTGRPRNSGSTPGIGKKFVSALGSTNFPVKCIPRTVARGIKLPLRDDDHPRPSSTECENECYTSAPRYVFMTCTWTTLTSESNAHAVGQFFPVKVRPHRTRSAAADCGLCPLRNVTF